MILCRQSRTALNGGLGRDRAASVVKDLQRKRLLVRDRPLGGDLRTLQERLRQYGFMTDEADGEFTVPCSRASDINVGPRLRMTVLRYIAQALDARLAGTGNLSEATTGYCTKDGDTSCDFAVLGKLTSVEVVQVGLTMPELPAELVQKTPSDGLSGKSDEENMGLKYADIHRYLREGSCGDPQTDEKIRKREAANMHKRRMPLTLNPFE